MYDELSVSFENPATDPLGYDHVEGKLYCGRDAVELQFKVRDRAFRKGNALVVPFTYAEVERVEYLSKWFRPKVLVFQTRCPEKLDDFPGASVGRVELQVIEASRRDAAKVADLIRYRQSEAFVSESESRLSRLRDGES
ncbi:MAG: hypothetical protein JNJ70_18925 [Verrucomicrobiales bacterium]|nr:hypothetical protein [Verrucomicrobiales bacterium]